MTKIESMMNKKFLDLWRDMESALKDEGPCTAMDLERNLEAHSRMDEASKLRMCRQIRNYLIHDGAGLVAATQEMCDFLEAMTYEILRVRGTMKDRMVTAAKYGAVPLDSMLSDACRTMLSKKRDSVLVLDDAKCLAGMLDVRSLAKALSDTSTDPRAMRVSYVAKSLMTDAACVLDTDPSKSGPECRAVVKDAKGRCVGVINPERGWR